MEGDVGWNHRTPRSTQGDAVLLPLVTRRIRPNRVHADLQLLLHLSFPFSLPFRPFPLFDLFSLRPPLPLGAWRERFFQSVRYSDQLRSKLN